MENPGYIALSRMIVQQRALDVRAANIANMNTPGFKAESVQFSDFLVRQTGTAQPPGGRTVQMVQDRATYRDFSQGQLTKTGNQLDLSLRGDGFFVVQTSNGERYTRAGRFSLSPRSEDRRYERQHCDRHRRPADHHSAWRLRPQCGRRRLDQHRHRRRR
jgi:flagellar basal-body rod protein FlgF